MTDTASIMNFLLIAGAAMLCSGFGTIVGFGGGVFMVPLLVVGFGVPVKFAIGAVVVGLFPSALISTVANLKDGLIDLYAAIILELPTIAGTILGAYLTSILPVWSLKAVFSLCLLALGIAMFRRTVSHTKKPSTLFTRLNGIGPGVSRGKGEESYHIGATAAAVFGLIAGSVAGLFGVGGGFLKTPIMIGVFGMPAKTAVGTALLMIVCTSFFATLSHAYFGHIRLDDALPTVSGFILGAIFGNILKYRFKEQHTETLISIGLGLAGVAMLADMLLEG